MRGILLCLLSMVPLLAGDGPPVPAEPVARVLYLRVRELRDALIADLQREGFLAGPGKAGWFEPFEGRGWMAHANANVQLERSGMPGEIVIWLADQPADAAWRQADLIDEHRRAWSWNDPPDMGGAVLAGAEAVFHHWFESAGFPATAPVARQTSWRANARYRLTARWPTGLRIDLRHDPCWSFDATSGTGTPGAITGRDRLPASWQEGWAPLHRCLTALAARAGATPAAVAPAFSLAATPSTLPLDGRSTAELRLRGPAGAAVAVRIQEEDGGTPGTLSAASATLDAQGEARLVFTTPAASAFARPPRQAKILASAGNLADEVNIAFEQTAFRLEAQPRYPGVAHAVMPGDGRFPAELRLTLRNPDRNDEPLAKEPLRLRVAGGPAELALLGPAAADGRRTATARGASLECETDAAGEAVLRLHWSGGRVAAPVPLTVEAEAPRRSLRASARVLAGLDLHLAGAQVAVRSGPGGISAGELVPLALLLRDPFHPEVRDLSPVLGWWQEGGAHGEHALLLDTAIGYGAEIPQYLTDLLGADGRRQPFRGLCVARYDAARGATVPMAVDAAVGLPRVQVATSGLNSFELSAHLATVVAGADGRGSAPVEEPLEKNNWAVAQLRAGAQADAAYLFLVENPFRPATPEGELLRRIVSLHGGASAVFALTDALDAVNRCDWGDLAAVASDRVMGAMTDRFAQRLDLIKKMSPGGQEAALRELAREPAIAAVYYAGQLAAMAGIATATMQVGGKWLSAAEEAELVAGAATGAGPHLAVIAERLDGLVNDAAAYPTLPYRAWVAVTGEAGEPELRDAAAGAPLDWQAERLRIAADGTVTIRTGRLLLAAAPAGRQLASPGRELRGHELAAPRRPAPSVELPGRGPRFADPAARAARERLDGSLRGAARARDACTAALLRAEVERLDAELAAAPSERRDELLRHRQAALAALHRLPPAPETP